MYLGLIDMTSSANPTPEFDVAALFDRLPIPLYATARDGRVLAGNRAFWEVFATPDDHKGATRTDDLYADPTERERVIAELDKSDIEVIDWEQVIDTPKGLRWIKPLARVVRDADGRMERFEGGFLTVTESIDAGPIEQQQRILLERTADPVLMLDPKGRLVWANAAARRLLQITEATVQARPAFAEVAGYDIPFEELVERSASWGEQSFMLKGIPRHFSVNFETHLGSDGFPAFYSIIGHDLSQRDSALSGLAGSILERDRVIETVAHEIKTPLTSVLGLSEELAARMAAAGQGEVAEIAATIAREALDLARIVDDLLETSDGAHPAPDLVPLDLRAEVHAAIATSGLAGVAVGGEAQAVADSSWIRRIVRNLLTNAQRYGAPPITIRLEDDDGWARVSVIDAGDGIDPAMAQSVFEPYVSTGAGEGTIALGLGLPVSRALAQGMGGQLTYTREGDSTVFTVRLPAA